MEKWKSAKIPKKNLTKKKKCVICLTMYAEIASGAAGAVQGIGNLIGANKAQKHAEEREDTAYQRSVKDMKLAGLNPLSGTTPADTASSTQAGLAKEQAKMQMSQMFQDGLRQWETIHEQERSNKAQEELQGQAQLWDAIIRSGVDLRDPEAVKNYINVQRQISDENRANTRADTNLKNASAGNQTAQEGLAKEKTETEKKQQTHIEEDTKRIREDVRHNKIENRLREKYHIVAGTSEKVQAGITALEFLTGDVPNAAKKLFSKYADMKKEELDRQSEYYGIPDDLPDEQKRELLQAVDETDHWQSMSPGDAYADYKKQCEDANIQPRNYMDFYNDVYLKTHIKYK